MIVFRHCGGILPFKNNLKEIILDDPIIETEDDNINYYSMAYGALKSSMLESDMNIPIIKRECRDHCECTEFYQMDLNQTDKYFLSEK